ncbi:response regulator transcription factor [Anoxynatronum buryatiense]|uniref:Stage 0 sporulation protein A homolog n=1 Tax=Anoxynatronum buryatiense TaxID=489973 RepID=A0AA45WUF3_9CLOT|nr:response regulator transcription factor [Anoxynatronum buryatiense]SMP43750.1 DNA-binding response regulator, OmpR family, contains REC and winged-helix (wHTH) domain [Anoxynatronum buryatiense]
MAGERILIVDDEPEILQLIQSYLLKENYVVFAAGDAAQALWHIKHSSPNLVILDIMLPDIDGIELCLEIRRTTNVPILFLSCKSEELDKVSALSVGGDDYMVKPFMPGELIARVKAHLRRARQGSQPDHQETIIRHGDLEINMMTHEVSVNNAEVCLSHKEFEILRILCENPKRIYSTEQLFQMVWKSNALEGDARTIMVYISNIRKKIESDPSCPQYILNVRGVGYKFNHNLM